MKISVIGTGYVGLVTGACFADVGNNVICVDKDHEKIEALKKGILPIFEPRLDELVAVNTRDQRLTFTTDLAEAIRETEVCFITVGTPMDEAGRADLGQVLAVGREIGRHLTGSMIVTLKSTVPVGTTDEVDRIIADELASRGANPAYAVVFNPEFLKEGDAVKDCFSPDRVVIGTSDHETAQTMISLYRPFVRNHDRFLVMDVRSAEMTKYASNAMLATRISFMNEIAGICEKVGADVNLVRLGVGSDSRIGYNFLYPGCGYGGSCFPKDLRALAHLARSVGAPSSIIEKVEEVNTAQKQVLLAKITDRFGADLTGRVFGVWGLSFKPYTDDMREAPSLTIVPGLLARGAAVRVYDPKALQEARHHLGEHARLTYAEDKYAVQVDADALLLITEWKEFRSPDFERLKKTMKTPVIFDGRNQYDHRQLLALGFEYWQIGRVPARPGLI
ncbi:MAG: UDP-glucose/GDP-mannose dehydrogenase family protein [Candidatus Adiutrix sp.]|jgi:UDPglucose 6-dehydrogenase|nr:UDP-glucose/GDP-mannose dehydrogenase family protein [Candidatus Adiutrix sp.]